MGEEEGLKYVIRFIPDTTEIDKSIKDISTRVSKEIKESIDKAREDAGVAGPAKPGEPTGGVIDRIFSEFKLLKDRVTSSLKEFGILSGRARGLQHPSSATVGSVIDVGAKKIAAGDPSKLSTDQALQLLAGATVAGGRVLAAEQVIPGVSKEEAVSRMMQQEVGGLKGIIDSIMGIKEFASMKGALRQIGLSDFYERGLGATGAARVKGTEQGLMESIGHGPLQEITKALMAKELPGAAEWEGTGMKFSAFAQELGMSETDAKALAYANKEVADIVRKVGDIIQIGETKAVSDVPKYVRDLMNVVDVFKQADIARAAAEPPLEPLDLKVQAKMYAGATRGDPERELGLIREQTEGGVIESIEYEDIGDVVRAVFIRRFKENLPALQSELETFMVDMAPSTARTHVEQLLSEIESLLEVLEARSLPKFWKDIGVDRWIRESAVAYVGTLKDEIAPRMQRVIEESGLPVMVADAPETATIAPTSDTEIILGMLETMDIKLDDIKSDLPQGSGTDHGGLLGSMRENLRSD